MFFNTAAQARRVRGNLYTNEDGKDEESSEDEDEIESEEEDEKDEENEGQVKNASISKKIKTFVQDIRARFRERKPESLSADEPALQPGNKPFRAINHHFFILIIIFYRFLPRSKISHRKKFLYPDVSKTIEKRTRYNCNGIFFECSHFYYYYSWTQCWNSGINWV